MRLRRAVVSLVLLGVVALPASAAPVLIDNSTVAILPSSSPGHPCCGGFPPLNAIDLGPSRYVTDYASNGAGTATHLDFAFPEVYAFSSVVYTDRTTSGGAQGAYYGGTSDFVQSYAFIFSMDPVFGDPADVTFIVAGRVAPAAPTSYLDFQTASALGGAPYLGQYVRWQVLATGYLNPGGADFEFHGEVVPEPGSMLLLGSGLLGLAGAVRRRFRR